MQTILLVEDDPDWALLMEQSLVRARASEAEAPLPHRIVHVETWSHARRAIDSQDCAAVLLDLGLPDIDLPKLLDEVQRLSAQVPFLILTGRADGTVAHEAIERGAQDYLLKGDVGGELLRRAVRYAISRQRTVQQIGRIQKRQLEARDELLSHVSHELRTPLAAIHQFTTLLLDRIPGELTAEQQEYLEIMLRNTLSLRDMVDDLMDVARAECGKLALLPRQLDTVELARDALRSLDGAARDRGVALQLSVEPDVPQAWADARRVRQILLNLVSNSLKFTPPGGRVDVRVAAATGGAVEMSVADTGCGIPEDVLPRVFDRLCQVERGGARDRESRSGLGLGLYICRELAENMGGRIDATSVPGRGSRFWVTLPGYALGASLAPLVAARGARARAASVEDDSALWLVRVSTTTDAGDPCPHAWLEAAAAHLAQAIAEGLAVALPRELLAEPGGLAVVALGGAAGAEALCRRIESELGALATPRGRPRITARPERLALGGDSTSLALEISERLRAPQVPPAHEGTPT